jgi:two-component system, sensor histidine kinase and response regulator
MTAPHVLIVDDDVALLQALPEALRLRMGGVTVDTCDSAPAALDRIAATDYDAIVSDIKMPGMDGLALMAEIRARRPETPTLLITGHGEHDLAVQALRGGAYDFIQKPIDRDYFVASLQRAIRMRQLARQVEEQKLALERHASELEQIVQARTHELIEANHAKDQFLAILSHELRTPLTPIQASVELLYRVADEPHRVREAARIIERNVRLQTSLVNDLLDLSRITRGKVSFQRCPVALGQLVSETLDGLRAEAEAAGLVLDWEPPGEEIYTEADPFRIQQVLLNLVGNAIKYTPAAGRVGLTLFRVGNAARLAVEDTGIGIAAESLPRIFQMFHQEEAGTGRRGLGIGLALVELLVQKHGGRVWAESEGLGRGSRFIVELPAMQALGARVDRSTPGSALGSDKDGPVLIPTERREGGDPGVRLRTRPPSAASILLVEDSADSRETLAEVLRLLGYQVRVAASAQEALAQLAGWRPDAILSDIGLPGTDGCELMRQVRRLPEQAGVVAVAVTGYGTREDRDAALAAGFDTHLAKPLDLPALDRQLQELLAGRRGSVEEPAGT